MPGKLCLEQIWPEFEPKHNFPKAITSQTAQCASVICGEQNCRKALFEVLSFHRRTTATGVEVSGGWRGFLAKSFQPHSIPVTTRRHRACFGFEIEVFPCCNIAEDDLLSPSTFWNHGKPCWVPLGFRKSYRVRDDV